MTSKSIACGAAADFDAVYRKQVSVDNPECSHSLAVETQTRGDMANR